VICANLSAIASAKIGQIATLRLGSGLAVLGAALALTSAFSGDSAFVMLGVGSVVAAAGVGLRTPLGFLLSISVCGEDVNRAAATVLVLTIGVTAAASVILALLIAFGVAPLALASGALYALGLMLAFSHSIAGASAREGS
jgi:hypothetical protein